MKGFLGFGAPMMLDIIIVASVVILIPGIVIAIKWAKKGEYKKHGQMMMAVTAIVIAASLLFEVELRMSGGIEGLAKAAGKLDNVTTSFYKNLLYVHYFFIFTGTLAWAMTIFGAIKNFSFKEPRPSMYGKMHRMLAYSSLILAAGIAVTGFAVYYYAFVA